MAVRQPLYYNGSNQLQSMSTSMVTEIVTQLVYQYSLSPSVSLSVVSSGGSLGTLTDTRLQAGAQSTSVSSTPSEGTTAEPSSVNTNYAKISETRTTLTPTTDTGKTWPAYYNSSNQIQAMTLQDVKDTFLHPAIDLLVSGSTTTEQAGTYHITTSASSSGSVEVSGASTPVFLDTRANTSLYTAGGIPETLDQPSTITSFYLQKITGSNTTYTLPIFVDGSNNLQTYPEATFESLIQEWIKHTAVSSSDGYSISYGYSTGTNRGSGMTDTRLNGSGNYQTRFVGADDYRAQEFPDGSPQTINTYYLKINKS